MDAFVPVVLVVLRQRREDAQLNARCIAILLYRADDFDGDLGLSLPVPGLNDLAKGTLAKQADDRVCSSGQCKIRLLQGQVVTYSAR